MERRKRRSRNGVEAAGLVLAEAAAQSGALAVALADGRGRFVAGAGGGYDLARLAALGERCADRVEADDAVDPLVDAEARGEDFYASRVTVRDATYYLVSVGARIRRQRAIATALDRILPR